MIPREDDSFYWEIALLPLDSQLQKWLASPERLAPENILCDCDSASLGVVIAKRSSRCLKGSE